MYIDYLQITYHQINNRAYNNNTEQPGSKLGFWRCGSPNNTGEYTSTTFWYGNTSVLWILYLVSCIYPTPRGWAIPWSDSQTKYYGFQPILRMFSTSYILGHLIYQIYREVDIKQQYLLFFYNNSCYRLCYYTGLVDDVMNLYDVNDDGYISFPEMMKVRETIKRDDQVKTVDEEWPSHRVKWPLMYWSIYVYL